MNIDYIKIARPDHWIKNLFILPGALGALLLLEIPFSFRILCALLAALLATSLAASANYVINEWLDSKFDKFHPVKKNRPAVAKGLKFRLVMFEYAGLAIVSLLVSLLIHGTRISAAIPFTVMTLWLLIMGILYNVEPIRTKDIPYLDVLSESVNNMIRLLMGWFAVTSNTLPPCSLILGYWLAGSFLMAIKRFAEYRMIGDSVIAARYRKSFAGYTESTLLVSGFIYALLSSFLIGVFLVKYRIEILIAMPFLFGMFAEYVFLAYKPDSAAQRPEKLYREFRLMFFTFAFLVALIFSVCVDIPLLENLFQVVKLHTFSAAPQ